MHCPLTSANLVVLTLLSGCARGPAYGPQDNLVRAFTAHHYYSPQRTPSMQGQPMPAPFPAYQSPRPAYQPPAESFANLEPMPPQVFEPASAKKAESLDAFTQCVQTESATGNYPSNDGGHAMLRMISGPCLNSRNAWIDDCESRNSQNGNRNANCALNSGLYAMIILKTVDRSLGNR